MAVVLGRTVDRSQYELDHRIRVVEAPTHRHTIQLIDYWQSCKAKGGMRMGRDIPSREIAGLLKDLMVSEPVDDWADARIRLAGFGMASHFGCDVSGRLMSEVFSGPDSDREMLLQGSKSSIRHNVTGTVEQTILDGNGTLVLRQEMTALPIFAPTGDARWILVGTFNF